MPSRHRPTRHILNPWFWFFFIVLWITLSLLGGLLA